MQNDLTFQMFHKEEILETGKLQQLGKEEHGFKEMVIKSSQEKNG